MFRAGYRNGCFRLHRKVLVKSCVIFRCGPSFNSFLYCFSRGTDYISGNRDFICRTIRGGKTTQAKLWERFRNARIICNDRTLLRKQDGNWYSYGYPMDGSQPVRSGEVHVAGCIVLVKQSQNGKSSIERMRQESDGTADAAACNRPVE